MNIKELDSIIEIVDTINYKIIERYNKNFTGDFGGNDDLGLYPRLVLSYVTDFGWYIDLDDVNVWKEYEDPRGTTADDEYEPLEQFLIRQIQEVSTTYSKLSKLK